MSTPIIDDHPPVSAAFVLAVDAIARAVGVTPLPKGLTSARIGDWHLTVNNGREALEHEGQPVPAWTVIGTHETLFAFAMLDPVGGGVGGCSEADFIDAMRAAGSTLGEANA